MASYRQHGIVFAERDPENRKSSVVFNHKYCLAPASLLLNIFDECHKEIQTTAKRDLKKDLRINRIIDTTNSQCYRTLANQKFKFIYENDSKLYETNARILYVFKSRNIWNSFNDILRCFVARSMPTMDGNTKPTSAMSVDDDLHKLLLSSFVILLLSPYDIDDSEKAYLSSDILLNIMNDDAERELGVKPRFKQKSENVGILQLNSVKKMENLESISTPFGNECFLNTINVGKVANIFGDNHCLLVASMPLVFGCEGGAIYNSSK